VSERFSARVRMSEIENEYLALLERKKIAGRPRKFSD
jgi:hypothetical protein